MSELREVAPDVRHLYGLHVPMDYVLQTVGGWRHRTYLDLVEFYSATDGSGRTVELPRDYRVVSVSTHWAGWDLVCVIEHPGFPAVPAGAMPEELRLFCYRVHNVPVKAGPDGDPRSAAGYFGPGPDALLGLFRAAFEYFGVTHLGTDANGARWSTRDFMTDLPDFLATGFPAAETPHGG